MRAKARQFLRDVAGIEPVEYAVATALLVSGVLIGVGGLLFAILPMLQRLTELVFSV